MTVIPLLGSGAIGWLTHCIEVGGRHVHMSAYITKDDEGYTLVDSGSFLHRQEVIADVNEFTDGEGIDTILLSHGDLPHTGNVSALRDEWDAVEIVSPSATPEIESLPSDTVRCYIDEPMTVNGRRWEFLEVLFGDRQDTVWMFDTESKTLFSADGFGSYHAEGACESTFDDIDGGVSGEDIYRYSLSTLPWLRYAIPSKVRSKIDLLREEYDVANVAPTHGSPLVGESAIDQYSQRFGEVTAQIAEAYDPAESLERPNAAD